MVVNTNKKKTLDKCLVLNSDKLKSSRLKASLRNWRRWGVPLCNYNVVFVLKQDDQGNVFHGSR